MLNTRHVSTDSLTLRVCCSVHCYLLAAEVTEEVGGGDGSAGDMTVMLMVTMTVTVTMLWMNRVWGLHVKVPLKENRR